MFKAVSLPVVTYRAWAAAVVALSASVSSQAADLSRLTSLLDATPVYGWTQINTNTFSDAFLPTGPLRPAGDPRAVVTAWSSAAWDSLRGDLLIYGGGHANYAGNEVYVLDGQSGLWSRGSLPSRIDPTTLFVVDNAAPQAAHTYDNNLYLPINDRFITFGGAAWNSGGNLQSASGRTGPWLWDPAKADPALVGGTTGSGYSAASAGGDMWVNRFNAGTGPQPANFVESATAYRAENGKDVVYISAPNAGGFASLYRYEVGNLASGGLDTWQVVGVQNSGAYTFQHAATVDALNGLYLATVIDGNGAARGADLSVWNLANNNAAAPGANSDLAVRLQYADGTPFVMNKSFGMDANTEDGSIYLWNQQDGGTVYRTKATYDAVGTLQNTWIIEMIGSTTAAQPKSGSASGGVLGKWDYVEELNAFIALETYAGGFSPGTGDAPVWLFKVADITAPIPEPSAGLLMLLGLGFGASYIKRRRAQG